MAKSLSDRVDDVQREMRALKTKQPIQGSSLSASTAFTEAEPLVIPGGYENGSYVWGYVDINFTTPEVAGTGKLANVYPIGALSLLAKFGSDATWDYPLNNAPAGSNSFTYTPILLTNTGTGRIMFMFQPTLGYSASGFTLNLRLVSTGNATGAINKVEANIVGF